MATSTTEGSGVAPIYADDERLQPLLGPGGPFEVETVVIDRVPLRDFVRAPRTIVDIFDMGAAHAKLVHLVHDDERLTFGDVHRQARSLARELQDTFGVRPGDRVAIAMRNLPEFVITFWGVALAGAIVVPLNGWWTGPELVHVLEDSGVSVAVMDRERLDRVVHHGRPEGVQLIGVRGAEGDVRFEDLVTGAPIDDAAAARLERDDPVTLLYTSGTTGLPKGAVSTNRAVTANIWNMAFANLREAIVSQRPPRDPVQSATLSTAPLFHIGGVASIIGTQMAGAKLILMRKWNVDEALRLAVEEHVTNFGGVPAVARQILDHPGVEDLGLDVRSFSMGGAAVPPDLPARVIELFGDDVQLLNGYGLTETTSAVATNVGAEFAARPESVGRPNLTADLRVEGPDGAPLGVGEIGELCFRSPQVVQGYWNNEEATKATFVDGWFHSGDIGYIDDEGFIHVVDRMKDVVIRGGENVYCAEVEGVLHEHPAVAQVTIVGVDETAMGERVCAVVVVRPGAEVTLADLRRFAASRLATFKCPEALWIVDELPATATGKIAKADVRRVVADAGDRMDRLW
jgi:long-chain acyl-CoA synthetase